MTRLSIVALTVLLAAPTASADSLQELEYRMQTDRIILENTMRQRMDDIASSIRSRQDDAEFARAFKEQWGYSPNLRRPWTAEELAPGVEAIKQLNARIEADRAAKLRGEAEYKKTMCLKNPNHSECGRRD